MVWLKFHLFTVCSNLTQAQWRAVFELNLGDQYKACWQIAVLVFWWAQGWCHVLAQLRHIPIPIRTGTACEPVLIHHHHLVAIAVIFSPHHFAFWVGPIGLCGEA